MTTDGYEIPDVVGISAMPIESIIIHCESCDVRIEKAPYYFRIMDASIMCPVCKERLELKE